MFGLNNRCIMHHEHNIQSKEHGGKGKRFACLKWLMSMLMHPWCSNGPDVELG